MISELDVNYFTAFEHANFKFSPGLNVIVGTNGAGKSHVLKLAYAVAKTSYNQKDAHKQSKAVWQKSIAENLLRIFRPETLGRLARKQQGKTATRVSIAFETHSDANFAFTFSTLSTTDVKIENDIPLNFAPELPIFIPTKELLSIFPGLRASYDSRELSIDETYPDLCDRLDQSLLKGARLDHIKDIVNELEQIIGAEVKKEHGKFYLYSKGGGRIEIDLAAEGIRKLATLAYLLKNGSLTNTTALFWDEPEANLNPLLIRKLANMLMLLSQKKFQIIIATHSLFLLKELHILSKQIGAEKVRYFGLSQNATFSSVVSVTDDLESLPNIASLDAELEQTDRFADALNEEDANNH